MTRGATPWLIVVLLLIVAAVIVGFVVMYLDLLHLASDWVDVHDGPVTD